MIWARFASCIACRKMDDTICNSDRVTQMNGKKMEVRKWGPAPSSYLRLLTNLPQRAAIPTDQRHPIKCCLANLSAPPSFCHPSPREPWALCRRPASWEARDRIRRTDFVYGWHQLKLRFMVCQGRNQPHRRPRDATHIHHCQAQMNGSDSHQPGAVATVARTARILPLKLRISES